MSGIIHDAVGLVWYLSHDPLAQATVSSQQSQCRMTSGHVNDKGAAMVTAWMACDGCVLVALVASLFSKV